MKILRKIAIFLIKKVSILNRVYWNIKTLGRIFSGPKDSIFIACMPKSGSTFLTTVLSELTGYKIWALKFDPENENDIYLPELVKSSKNATITQQHMRATVPNLTLLNYFSIRPIVAVRNIFDLVVSIRDHIYSEESLHEQYRNFLTMHINNKFYDLPDNVQLDFIIDMILPWYFSFYASWYDAYVNNRIEMLWLNYEDIVSNDNSAFERILIFYGIDSTMEGVDEAIRKATQKNIRYNKAVSGRGRRILTKDQQERVVRLSNYYPWVDFSQIGL